MLLYGVVVVHLHQPSAEVHYSLWHHQDGGIFDGIINTQKMSDKIGIR